MAVKCGNCKDYHENSAGVKQCYGNSGKLPNAELPQVYDAPGASRLPAAPVREHRPSPVDEIRAAARSLPNVATAYYAIEEMKLGEFAGSTEKVWRFYKIDRPQDGRWKGYTFVKVQASDDFHPVKSLSKAATILTAIAFDAKQAAIAYGHQLGRCGICNRTLTDAESIQRGIGPVCASKVGW